MALFYPENFKQLFWLQSLTWSTGSTSCQTLAASAAFLHQKLCCKSKVQLRNFFHCGFWRICIGYMEKSVFSLQIITKKATATATITHGTSTF